MGKERLVRPCEHCPFRNDIDPHLTYERAEEIADSLYGGAMFPCHKTTTHDEEGEYIPRSDEQFCAGAAITMLKCDGPNNYMRVMGRIGVMDFDRLEKEGETAPLYEDLKEWIAAHE